MNHCSMALNQYSMTLNNRSMALNKFIQYQYKRMFNTDKQIYINLIFDFSMRQQK